MYTQAVVVGLATATTARSHLVQAGNNLFEGGPLRWGHAPALLDQPAQLLRDLAVVREPWRQAAHGQLRHLAVRHVGKGLLVGDQLEEQVAETVHVGLLAVGLSQGDLWRSVARVAVLGEVNGAALGLVHCDAKVSDAHAPAFGAFQEDIACVGCFSKEEKKKRRKKKRKKRGDNKVKSEKRIVRGEKRIEWNERGI